MKWSAQVISLTPEVSEFTPAWEVHKDDPNVIGPSDGHRLLFLSTVGIHELDGEDNVVGLWLLPTIGHISFKED